MSFYTADNARSAAVTAALQARKESKKGVAKSRLSYFSSSAVAAPSSSGLAATTISLGRGARGGQPLGWSPADFQGAGAAWPLGMAGGGAPSAVAAPSRSGLAATTISLGRGARGGQSLGRSTAVFQGAGAASSPLGMAAAPSSPELAATAGSLGRGARGSQEVSVSSRGRGEDDDGDHGNDCASAELEQLTLTFRIQRLQRRVIQENHAHGHGIALDLRLQQLEQRRQDTEAAAAAAAAAAGLDQGGGDLGVVPRVSGPTRVPTVSLEASRDDCTF